MEVHIKENENKLLIALSDSDIKKITEYLILYIPNFLFIREKKCHLGVAIGLRKAFDEKRAAGYTNLIDNIIFVPLESNDIKTMKKDSGVVIHMKITYPGAKSRNICFFLCNK